MASSLRQGLRNTNLVATAVDELEGWSTKANGVGIEGIVSATLGSVSFDLLGGYDTEWEEGAIRALLSADPGPGTLQVAGIWASNPNTYWRASEWSVAASYAFKHRQAEDHPGVQYFDSLRTGNEFNNDLDKWRAGVTLDYAVTEGLAARVSVQYNPEDLTATTDRDYVAGFVRLQRNF